jgi:hypothetical protein
MPGLSQRSDRGGTFSRGHNSCGSTAVPATRANVPPRSSVANPLAICLPPIPVVDFSRGSVARHRSRLWSLPVPRETTSPVFGLHPRSSLCKPPCTNVRVHTSMPRGNLLSRSRHPALLVRPLSRAATRGDLSRTVVSADTPGCGRLRALRSTSETSDRSCACTRPWPS